MQGCAVTRKRAQPAGPRDSTASGTSPPEATEQKGDILIRELWANGTDSVHVMRVMNTDAKSYWGRSPMWCCHGVRRAELSSSSRRNPAHNTILNNLYQNMNITQETTCVPCSDLFTKTSVGKAKQKIYMTLNSVFSCTI